MKYIYIFLMLFCTMSVYGQSQLSGRVVDEAGDPLVGASIVIKGTTNGTITDADGRFSLSAAADNDLIIISFIGFETQEILVGNQTELNIVLLEDVASLGEVVVIGYGEQSKKEVTTAVATVDAKTIEALPMYRPEQALQGTAPGVIVQQNSGSPGAPLTVRVRGISTAGGSQPLYLVDGLQVPDLNYLNSNDIQDISILKDAAAAAIYGARGGNGVILVTTKKGKRTGGPQLSLNGSTGFQNLISKPSLMDKDQFVDYYNEYQNANGGTPFTDEDRAALPNTDWYDEVFDSNVPVHDYNVSLSDGGERYSYYVSGGLFDQKGMVGGDAGKSQFSRYNAKAAFEVDILDNLNLSVGADLVKVERDYLYENQAGTGVAIMNYINAIPAIYPAFDPDNPDIPFHVGDQSAPIEVNGVTVPAVGAVLNPHVALELTNNRTTQNIRSFNTALEWEPVKNLTLRGTYQSYTDDAFDKQFNPAFDYTPFQNLSNPRGNLRETTFLNRYQQYGATAQYYFKNLGDHNLDILAGFAVLEFDGSTNSMSGTDFYVNTFEDVNFALIKDNSNIVNATPVVVETALRSFFGRINYNYREKFLFSATLRNDASSKFGADNRSGFFPSFSAGWVLSEESFMRNSRVFDLFKVRASWGINGNDNINPYQYTAAVNTNSGPSFGGQNTPGLSLGFLPNADVKWEEISQTNIGLDINAFNNTFGLSFDYYDKKTTDMLVPVGTPTYTGYNSAAANVADVENKGVELLLTYKKTYSNKFSWNAGFNLGYNDNNVTGLGNDGQPINGGNIGFIFSEPISRTDIGQPIASFYGYQIESIDADGNFVFKDNDGEAGISESDKTFIGSPFPDFTYGVTLGAEFAGFDLSAFLYGQSGNEIFDANVRLDAANSTRTVGYAGDNAPKNILGAGATVGAPDQLLVSDFYVKNGSFAKLKFLTLGYSLPERVIQNIGMTQLRFYVTGQNLFVITDYDGPDPEIGQAFSNTVLDVGIDRGFYPQPRAIILGFQVKF